MYDTTTHGMCTFCNDFNHFLAPSFRKKNGRDSFASNEGPDSISLPCFLIAFAY